MNLFSLFLFFFGVKKIERYSIILDDGYVFKEIFSVFLVVDIVCFVVIDFGDFQVVLVDEELLIIIIRECKFDFEF